MPDFDLTQFDPPAAPAVAPEAPTPQSDFQANPMRWVVNKLHHDYGWSPEAASGIAGNLYFESTGMKPHVWGDGGNSFGLAQWNGPRRQALVAYASGRGKPADDPELQLEFLNHELMTDYTGAADHLRRAKTPDEAARLFSQHYEKPGQPKLSGRTSLAKEAYGYFNEGPRRAVTNEYYGLDKKPSNCGEGVTGIINPQLQALGGDRMLPMGGLGESDVTELAQHYGAPVLNKSQITAETLRQAGPGTIVWMKRNSKDPNFASGPDHTEVVMPHPQTGELVIHSYTSGKGWSFKPIDERYIDSLAKHTIATNPFSLDRRAGAVAATVPQPIAQFDPNEFDPPDAKQAPITKFDPGEFDPPTVKGNIIDALPEPKWPGGKGETRPDEAVQQTGAFGEPIVDGTGSPTRAMREGINIITEIAGRGLGAILPYLPDDPGYEAPKAYTPGDVERGKQVATNLLRGAVKPFSLYTYQPDVPTKIAPSRQAVGESVRRFVDSAVSPVKLPGFKAEWKEPLPNKTWEEMTPEGRKVYTQKNYVQHMMRFPGIELFSPQDGKPKLSLTDIDGQVKQAFKSVLPGLPPEYYQSAGRLVPDEDLLHAQSLGSFLAIPAILGPIFGATGLAVDAYAPALVGSWRSLLATGFGAGVTYDVLSHAGEAVGRDIAGQPQAKPQHGGLAIEAAKYLSSEEVAAGIERATEILGPNATGLDFMLFGLGAMGATKAVQGTVNWINKIIQPFETRRYQARVEAEMAGRAAEAEAPINTDPQTLEEAIQSYDQMLRRNAGLKGEAFDAAQKDLNTLVKKNAMFRQARQFMDLKAGFEGKSEAEILDIFKEKLAETERRAQEKQVAKEKAAPEKKTAPDLIKEFDAPGGKRVPPERTTVPETKGVVPAEAKLIPEVKGIVPEAAKGVPVFQDPDGWWRIKGLEDSDVHKFGTQAEAEKVAGRLSKSPEPAAEGGGGAGKEPWEMTRNKFVGEQTWPDLRKLSDRANEIQKQINRRWDELSKSTKFNEYDATEAERDAHIEQVNNLAANDSQYQKLLQDQKKQQNHTASYQQESEAWLKRDREHKEAVKQAIASGKPVPPEVLKDYPDLQPAPEQGKGGGVPGAPPKPQGASPGTPVWTQWQKDLAVYNRRQLMEKGKEAKGGNAPAPGPVVKQILDQGKAKKLRQLADNLQPQIDARFNPGSAQQRPTARRAAMVASSYAEAERLQKVQTILNRLADLHEAGEVPEPLSKISSKTAVEDLLWSNFPKPGISRVHLVDLLDQTKNKAQGITSERRHLSAMIMRGDTWIPFTASDLPALEKVAAKSGNYAAKAVKDQITKAKRLTGAGIETKEKWEEARKLALEMASKKPPTPKEVELKRQERELIGLKIPGYFPTPRETAAQMVKMADIQPGMDVLEPSAGNGNIADAIQEQAPEAKQDVIEWNTKLAGILETKGHNVVGHDFLKNTKKYDRIVMNPPFENGQDMDHVRHAYDSLKPGGRLVSIMSEGPFFRGDKKATSFREWLEEVGGSSEKLPEKTFAKEVRATGVNGRIVVIDRPAELKKPSRLTRKPAPTTPAEFSQQHGTARGKQVEVEDPEELKKAPFAVRQPQDFALTSGKPKSSKLETRLDALQDEYPGIDREKAATVLRALPQAENFQVAAMSADPAMFNQVARGNLKATEVQQLLKKASDAGQQMDLPGLTPPGRLFSVKTAPTFYSQMAIALEGKLPGKGGGPQLADLLEGWAAKGQFKADELRWSGVIPWLREQTGPVTKQQVLDKIKEGMVQVRVVVKGNLGGELYSKWRDIHELPPYSRTPEEKEFYDKHREQFAKYPAKEFENKTKFQNYLTDLPESFTNRREMLLVVPVEESKEPQILAKLRNLTQQMQDMESNWRKSMKPQYDVIKAERSKLLIEAQEYKPPGKPYKVPSSHAYGDPAADVNRFAHVFLADYVDPKTGAKNLVVTEAQSDWAREGREKGYGLDEKEKAELEAVKKELHGKRTQDARYFELIKIKDTLEGKASRAVPPLPFAKNWHEVALKQALRFAAENGYDGLMVVNGKMVFQRWGSEAVAWRTLADTEKRGTVNEGKNAWMVGAKEQVGGTAGGVNIEEEARARGILQETDQKLVTTKEQLRRIVRDTLSRERTPAELDKLTDRIWDRMQTEPEGTSMPRKDFFELNYDTKYPNFLKKYGKQWGAEVGKRRLVSPDYDSRVMNRAIAFAEWAEENHGVDITRMGDRDPEYGALLDSFDRQYKIKHQENVEHALTHLPITPAMSESVLTKGQPLYKERAAYETFTEWQQKNRAAADLLFDRQGRHPGNAEVREAAGRLLEDAKSRGRGYAAGPEEQAIWDAIRLDESRLSDPEFRALQKSGSKWGVSVLPVQDFATHGVFVPGDNPVILLDRDSGPHTPEQIFGHEEFHHRARGGDPAAVALVDRVNPFSPVFKAYQAAMRQAYELVGLEAPSIRTLKEEVAADFAAGMMKVDVSGQVLDLSKAFKDPGTIPTLKKRYDRAQPKKGAGVEGASKFMVKRPPPEGKGFLGLDESGQIDLRLLTPGFEAASNLKQAAQSLVLPTAKSPEHLRAGEVLGAKLGTMHRSGEAAVATLKGDKRYFDKLGVHNPGVPLEQNPGVKFASDVSQGRSMAPRETAIAKRIDALFKDRLDRLEKADVPLENVREYYFPGMWTQASIKAFNQAVAEALEPGYGMVATGSEEELAALPNINDWSAADKKYVRDRVKEILEKGEKGSDKSALSYLTRRPFKGKESFRKGKVFDDFMTPVEFGLVPISPNPIDLVELKLAEMDRSIMANSAIQEWKKRGDVKFNPATAPTPEGWVRVNDKYGTVYGPPIEGEYGRRIMGYYIAKEPVADVLNNYLSSSLYNNKYFGIPYRGVMAAGNTLNQFQLGVFSSFHAGFTSIETQITSGAEVIKDVYGVARGNRTPAQLGKTLARYPVTMAKTAMEGNKVLAEWANPTMDVPTNVPVGQLPTTWESRIAQIAKAAEIAGAGFIMEKGLVTTQTNKMVREWHGGQKFKAALRSPIALTEISMKPVMEWLVPRQKAGIFAELVGRLMDQNPGKTLEELRPQLRAAWNRVDARLGQVRYDRLFMHNIAKNVMQLFIRAPGWTFGTIAEIGGAPKDAAKFFAEWAKTGKAPQDIPDRVAYVLSLLLTMFTANALLTYGFTGEKFWESDTPLLDLVAFRDGGKDDKGNPTRWLLPSYMKDLYAWSKNGIHTLVAKTHPLLSLIGELARNRDYYNNMIYDEEKGLFNKDSAIRIGQHVAKSYVPFWMRGASEIAEREGGFKETLKESPGKLIAPEFGIMPATRAYTQTALDEVMNRYNRIQITRTPEQGESLRLKRESQALLRKGKEAAGEEKLLKATREGKVPPEKAVDWLMEAGTPAKEVQFRRLPLDWQAKALLEANSEEMQMLLPLMLDRLERAKEKDIEKAEPFINQLLEKREKEQKKGRTTKKFSILNEGAQ